MACSSWPVRRTFRAFPRRRSDARAAAALAVSARRRPAFPTRADFDAGVALLLAGRAAGELILGVEPIMGSVVDHAMATRALGRRPRR
jgi:hypothetical protein